MSGAGKDKAYRDALRSARISLGLTLREAAQLLGVSPAQLSQLEHGPSKLRWSEEEHEVQCSQPGCERTFMARTPVGAVFVQYICPKCRESSP